MAIGTIRSRRGNRPVYFCTVPNWHPKGPTVSIEGLLERRERLLGPGFPLFYDKPVHLVRGEGVWLYDSEGGRYLDCYNNVPHVGHCHPHVVEALARQAAI